MLVCIFNSNADVEVKGWHVWCEPELHSKIPFQKFKDWSSVVDCLLRVHNAHIWASSLLEERGAGEKKGEKERETGKSCCLSVIWMNEWILETLHLVNKPSKTWAQVPWLHLQRASQIFIFFEPRRRMSFLGGETQWKLEQSFSYTRWMPSETYCTIFCLCPILYCAFFLKVALLLSVLTTKTCAERINKS